MNPQLEDLKRRVDALEKSSTITYATQKASEERMKNIYCKFTKVSIDAGITSAQGVTDTTVTVLGAEVGDLVVLGVPDDSHSVGVWWAWVSATNVITVRFANHTANPANPSPGVFKVGVIKVP